MTRFTVFALLTWVTVLACPELLSAQIILHDEGVNGDLSNNQLAPNPFVLSAGNNNVIGSVIGGTDTRDWVSVTIPALHQMSVLRHIAYSSTDPQGFVGFDDGATFPGGVNTPMSYQGYAHFGTAATNGTLPVTNTVGLNMFSIMSNPSAYFLGQEPQGVTLPLGPGTYTFLFQQTGATLTGYEFSFEVVAVPEPTSLMLASSAVAGCWIIRRRRMAKCNPPQ